MNEAEKNSILNHNITNSDVDEYIGFAGRIEEDRIKEEGKEFNYLSDETFSEVKIDLEKFYSECVKHVPNILVSYISQYDYSTFFFDFYLSRNQEGAGFFSRPINSVDESRYFTELQDIAEACGEWKYLDHME